MVGMDTMAIGGSDIAKDLLRVRQFFIFIKKKLKFLFIFSKWKK
jgi:hypothetical protein